MAKSVRTRGKWANCQNRDFLDFGITLIRQSWKSFNPINRGSDSVNIPHQMVEFTPVDSHTFNRYIYKEYIKEINMSYKINIIIEKDEFGYYAYSPMLEGCQTQGETLEETLSNMREAVELYLETLSKEESRQMLSKEILNTTLEVQVA